MSWLPGMTSKGGPSERPEHDAVAAKENEHSGYSLADMRMLLDTIYADARRHESKRLAESVQRALVSRLRGVDQHIPDRGVKTAVVTSSRNGREVLRASDIAELFDARVDGLDAEAFGLPGKPAPDTFLKAADLLGVPAGRAVVIEDAISGVEAGCRGGFGLVVGVDRGGNRDALTAHGADLVVGDLGELEVGDLDARLRDKRETITAWCVEQEGFDAAREHEMESIFTVGNGYLGVRGALDAPLPGSQGDLLIAGVYDRKHADRPYSELEFHGGGRGDDPYSELASGPFPFRLRLTVDGAPLDLAGPHWRVHRRVLDLRRGILHGHGVYETEGDRRTTTRSQRCASLHDLRRSGEWDAYRQRARERQLRP